jgi:hypothetical protein
VTRSVDALGVAGGLLEHMGYRFDRAGVSQRGRATAFAVTLSASLAGWLWRRGGH